jgi:hypothetical protein
MMAGTGRELLVAHHPQDPAQRPLGNRDAGTLEQDLSQIDQPPAQHSLRRRYRPLLDESTQHLALLGIQTRARNGALPPINVRAVGVKS